jgi:hypothetical protein
MAKYIIKREYTTTVHVNGKKVSENTGITRETVTGDIIAVAKSMLDAQSAYIDGLRIPNISFGEQKYNKDDIITLGCSFSAIHHKGDSYTLSFYLSQYSERITD